MPYVGAATELTRIIKDRTGVEIAPRILSEMFYQRRFPGVDAPIIGGRRMVNVADVPAIIHALKRAGRLPADVNAFA